MDLDERIKMRLFQHFGMLFAPGTVKFSKRLFETLPSRHNQASSEARDHVSYTNTHATLSLAPKFDNRSSDPCVYDVQRNFSTNLKRLAGRLCYHLAFVAELD